MQCHPQSWAMPFILLHDDVKHTIQKAFQYEGLFLLLFRSMVIPCTLAIPMIDLYKNPLFSQEWLNSNLSSLSVRPFYFGSHSSGIFFCILSDFLALKNKMALVGVQAWEWREITLHAFVKDVVLSPQNNQGHYAILSCFSFLPYLGWSLPIRGNFYINSVLYHAWHCNITEPQLWNPEHSYFPSLYLVCLDYFLQSKLIQLLSQFSLISA